MAPLDAEAFQCLEYHFPDVKTDAGSPRHEGARFPMWWPTMTARLSTRIMRATKLRLRRLLLHWNRLCPQSTPAKFQLLW